MEHTKKRTWRPAACTALLAVGMAAALYAVLGIFPFGDASVLTGDLNAQYIPYFVHFRRALESGGSFAASFEKSLGGGLAGLFAYYCASPFNLLYLLFPVEGYATAAGLVLAARLVAASALCTLFLGRQTPAAPPWAQVALGLCYGFCGYGIAYSQNTMFHDVLVLLPLLCLGLDRLVRDGRPLLYAVSLAVTVFADFYLAFAACGFCVLYFAWRLVTAPPRWWRGALVRFAAASLAGGLLPARLWLPALFDVNASKGALTAFTFSWERQFSLPQLPARLLPGNFAIGELENGLPLLYCGLLVLPLVWMYFLGRQVPWREKLASGVLLAVLVLSFWVKGLDTLWHGGKVPVWFPYRYSFLLCFWLVFLAAAAAARVRLTKRLCALTAGGCALVFAAALVWRAPTFGRRLWLAGLLAAALLLALLWAASKRKAAAWAAVAVCVCELGLNAAFVLGQMENYSVSGFAAFVKQGTQAVQTMAEQTGAPFRAEKTGIRTLNDPMLLGYRGVSHFGSTQDDASVDALTRLGYGNYGGCNTYLYGSTPAADAILGIRWLMVPPDGKPASALYAPAFMAGDWQVVENPFALPLAITANGAAAELPLENGEDLFLWQQRLLGYLAGQDCEGVYTPTPAAVTGAAATLTVQADGLLYALLKTETPTQLTVDGAAFGTVGDAENQGVICLGRHVGGETLALAAESPVTALYAYTLDEAALAEACRGAAARGADITAMRDGYVSLTAQAAAGEVLWVSTGYSGQWQASVNGKPVEALPLAGCFLGVPLEAGANTVELCWRTPGAGAGWALTALGVVLLAALAAAPLLRKKQGTATE